jgi:hypothetical protein
MPYAVVSNLIWPQIPCAVERVFAEPLINFVYVKLKLGPQISEDVLSKL